MEDTNKLEEIIGKIEADKKVLSVMPKNNEKNKDKYKKQLEELKEEFQQYKSETEKILKQRYDKEVKIEENKDIKLLDSKIKSLIFCHFVTPMLHLFQ